MGLAATGIIELLAAVLTGSAGLPGDAIRNLSDVPASAVVFPGRVAMATLAGSGPADVLRLPLRGLPRDRPVSSW
jgi:hypothetical protein